VTPQALLSAASLLVAMVVTGGSHPVSSVPRLELVSLGDSEAEIRSRLGSPSSSVDAAGDSTLGMGPTRALHYPGLVVGVHQRPGSSVFQVWRFEVSSSAWRLVPDFIQGRSLGRFSSYRRLVMTICDLPPNNSFERATGLRPVAAQLMIRSADQRWN
jgi:hypothetical protein